MLTIHDRFGERLGWGGVGEGKELKSCVGSWEQLCKQSGVVADAVLAVVVAVGRKQGLKLNDLDQGQSSYEYLKSFQNWLNDTLEQYTRLHKFIYPVLFLATIYIVAFNNLVVRKAGMTIWDKIMSNPDTLIYFGVPVLWIVPTVLITILITIFSAPIYRADVGTIYGSIIKKIDEMVKDMEELRGQ